MLGKLPLSSSLSPSTMVCDGNFFLRNITPPEIFQFSSEAVLNQMFATPSPFPFPLSHSPFALSPSPMVCDGNFFLRNVTPPEIFQFSSEAVLNQMANIEKEERRKTWTQFSSEAVLNQMANIEKELRLSDEAGENGGNNEWGNWL